MKPAFNPSHREEIICALWALCAILCFGFEFRLFAWIFTIKATLDFVCLTLIAVKEALREFKSKRAHGDIENG